MWVAHLKMSESLVGERLVFAQSLNDDCVSTFSIDLDFSVGHPDDSGHSLACGVELANIQNFNLVRSPLNVYKDRFWLSHLEPSSRVSEVCVWVRVYDSRGIDIP